MLKFFRYSDTLLKIEFRNKGLKKIGIVIVEDLKEF
jgi:hypothetical protein